MSLPPLGRNYAATLYDDTRQRIFVFGGELGTGGASDAHFRDTWRRPSGTRIWAQYNPAVEPSARSRCSVTHDTNRDVYVLRGGALAGTRYNETWEFDPAVDNWTQILPAAQPNGIYEYGLAFDATNNLTVLFGGKNNAGANLTETWTYDGVNWTNAAPATTPTSSERPKLVFDPGTGLVILFVASDTSTWSWNGTDWTLRSGPGGLPGTFPTIDDDFGLVYDTARSRVLLYASSTVGGFFANSVDILCELNTTTWAWADRTPITLGSPTALDPFIRTKAPLEYDQTLSRFYVFSQAGGPPSGEDEWELNTQTSTWERIQFTYDGTYLPVTGTPAPTVIYTMRAYKTTPTTGYVYWQVTGSPDPTGAQSGYNPGDLTDIVIVGVVTP